MPINYEQMRVLLEFVFQDSENKFLQGASPPTVPPKFAMAIQALFQSKTQAFRETLLGCILVRIQDQSINLRQPYVKQGPNAYSGRSVDERCVNPVLKDKRVPSSTGPYLSAFRRSIQFVEETAKGVRDKEGYAAFLYCLNYLESTETTDDLQRALEYLIWEFLKLREQSEIRLTKVQRISLEQWDQLLTRLLATPSGGRIPVFVVVAAFQTIQDCYSLNWDIQWQGINVADAPSGRVGDVSILVDDKILMSAEITERVVDRERVISTFNTKIGPYEIQDYLFFAQPSPDSQARRQASLYFAQGHEVNFLDIKNWITMLLATVGFQGRAVFGRKLLELFAASEVPQSLKISWNDHVNEVISG